MGRPRTAGMFVALLALPVALLGALLGALPAVAWQLPDALSFTQHDAVWTAHGPDRLHRGVKVKVTGVVQGELRPGTSVPILLTFQNPNRHKVQMKRVRVRIGGIVAPNADAAHPCTTADFSIQQMSRRTLLQLRSKRSTDLAALHLPMDAWPWLTMLNRPLNQDGCKGADVTLRLKARGLRR
jgi:hypothetical protein